MFLKLIEYNQIFNAQIILAWANWFFKYSTLVIYKWWLFYLWNGRIVWLLK